MSTRSNSAPLRVRVVSAGIAIGLIVVTIFITIRLLTDVPHLSAGTLPEDPFSRNFVRHPWLTYLHIGPGALYLFGAPLQLSARFRRTHLTLHRRLGRVLLASGLVSALFAIVFGVLHPYGGPIESAASVAFGCWFLACLTLAFAAVRRRDIAQHRRWMIRAFAVGIGIATIRLWVGTFIAVHAAVTGLHPDGPVASTFGLAFWLGFACTALVGEWWLRRPGLARIRPA